MRRTPLAVLALMTTTALAACGDNSPAAPTEASPAVTKPAPGVPAQAAPEATATPQPQTTPAEGMQGGTDDWRKVANTADASLLGRLDQAWRMARAEAEEGGFSRQVEALGPLADPNAGQSGRVQPGQGNYRCRTIKMGSRNGSGLAYVEYPWFRCTVELTAGGDLILTKLTGSQRTRGSDLPRHRPPRRLHRRPGLGRRREPVSGLRRQRRAGSGRRHRTHRPEPLAPGPAVAQAGS